MVSKWSLSGLGLLRGFGVCLRRWWSRSVSGGMLLQWRWRLLFSCWVAQSCPTLCDPMDCSTPGFPVLHQLPEFTQTHVHWIGDVIHPSCPLSSPSSLLSVFPSIRIFFNELALCIKWPKYWSFSFSINPSNEYSGLISFRVDWFDLLAVQGTLKSLLQHHISKASILWRSAFFMVHLSHPYMTTGKTIPLTIWTFVSRLEVPHLLRAAVEGRFIKAFRQNDC